MQELMLAMRDGVRLLALLAAAAEPIVQKDVPVAMRDGVVLRADVWRPAAGGRFPVLIHRTPYGKHAGEQRLIRRAVERGYAVVTQDVRGRYASGGEFEPYRNEGRDGYDTIEWAAVQAWSDGRVGSFGLSYPGAVQWLAAVESPPHLLAMVPAMTFSSPRHFFYAGGVWDMSWISWIWHNIAPDARVRKGLSGPRTGAEARSAWRQGGGDMLRRVPLDGLVELREVAPYYFEWLGHPPEDPWWDWAELRGRYSRVTAAVLNYSGWHDEAYGPEGATANHAGLLAARGGEAASRTRLVIGPWTHGAEDDEMTRSGERIFGEPARIDYGDMVLRFLDRHVRGVTNGLEREPPVRVFVMGDNTWREADTWPLPGVERRDLYLHGPAAPGTPGLLSWEPAAGGAVESAFVSDPEHPVEDPAWEAPGAHDYRWLGERPDTLVFETPSLERDLVVVGSTLAEVVLSADAPDLDLWVKLLDVAPDGTAFNLMSPGQDVLRARYRGGWSAPAPLVPGQATTLRITNLITANAFKRGHRVRVVLAASFFPAFSRNPQTGQSETSSARMRKARIQVHHSARHPSRLVLPVLSR
jgi:putative CocE/NonD family hydrolase